MADKTAKIVRMYSLNQKKVDEACFNYFQHFILEVVSDKALKKMLGKLQKKLGKPPVNPVGCGEIVDEHN